MRLSELVFVNIKIDLSPLLRTLVLFVRLATQAV